MRNVILSCLICVSPLVAVVSTQEKATTYKSWQEELEAIDQELARLDQEQTRLKMSATRWQNKGSDWQFQQGMTQEAKRAFAKADADKAQMAINQKKIDVLTARREKILQQHPEAPKTNVPK